MIVATAMSKCSVSFLLPYDQGGDVKHAKGEQGNINTIFLYQGSHRLEKYLNSEGFLEKSLKVKSPMKNTGKSVKSLEKSLNFTIFCST